MDRNGKGQFVKGHNSKWITRIIQICAFCKLERLVLPSKVKRFCSHECYSKSKIGKKHNWGYKISKALKGKPKSPEHIKNAAEAKRGIPRPDIQGENAPWWKGDLVGYDALHDWIRDRLPRPALCVQCFKLAKKSNGHWNVHWANISGKYKRDLEDWIALCRRCHYYYDKKRGHPFREIFPDGKHRVV